MTELRVPTKALDVEIVYADGTWYVGRIFLPIASSHHSGEMRPDEWINDSTPFFPFLPVNAGATIILNRSEVVVLTVVAEPPPEDEAPWTSPSAACRSNAASASWPAS